MLKASVVFKHQFDRYDWGDKHYNYFTNINDLKQDDLVVVETRFGFAVAKFVSYIDKFEVKATKHIVQKVELDEFYAEKERLKKIKHIENKIKHKAEKANKRKFYDQLAEHDPELKIMLDTLDSLQK